MPLRHQEIRTLGASASAAINGMVTHAISALLATIYRLIAVGVPRDTQTILRAQESAPMIWTAGATPHPSLVCIQTVPAPAGIPGVHLRIAPLAHSRTTPILTAFIAMWTTQGFIQTAALSARLRPIATAMLLTLAARPTQAATVHAETNGVRHQRG
jgi:hypothetical protein